MTSVMIKAKSEFSSSAFSAWRPSSASTTVRFFRLRYSRPQYARIAIIISDQNPGRHGNFSFFLH
jgi:hypothetical protein